MEILRNQKSIILILAGLLITAISQIITHYLTLPDFANGIFVGVGIGFIILALIKKEF